MNCSILSNQINKKKIQSVSLQKTTLYQTIFSILFIMLLTIVAVNAQKLPLTGNIYYSNIFIILLLKKFNFT